MKILVSGGLGFVGRNVSKYLIENGHEVLIVDNLVRGSGAKTLDDMHFKFRKVLQNARILNTDIRDFDVNKYSNFDSIIHLAAIVGGREMIEKYPLAVAEDLEIDAHVIRNWEQGRFEHLTYLSSSAAYPIKFQKVSGHLLREVDINFDDDISMPDLSYGWSKLTGEFLIKLAKERSNLSATVIRPFSGYGIDQDLAYPFPSIFKRALLHERDEVFYVWGSGKQERDFIYIDDVAKSICEFTLKKLNTTTNLETGFGITFIELARLFLEQLGHLGVIISGKTSQPEGVMSRVGDTKIYFDNLDKCGIQHPRYFNQIVSEHFQNWIDFEK